MDQKTFRILEKNALFCDLEKNDFREIEKSGLCRIAEFDAGDTVLSPESHAREAGVILLGKCEIYTKDLGHTTRLRELTAGDAMGITLLFSDSDFPTRILAQTKCRVVFFEEDAIRSLLLHNEKFLTRYLSFTAGRIHFLNRKIGFLTAGSAERRLALYLASFGKTDFVLSDSLTTLSDLLGLGRASLYRAFDKLEKDELIKRDGRRILIPNLDFLLQKYRS